MPWKAVMFSFTGQLSMPDPMDPVDIVVTISKTTDGLVAETELNYVKYVSDAVVVDFLGDATREKFADMHERFPPMLGEWGDTITVEYWLRFMERTLSFVMKKREMTTPEELMGAHQRTLDEVERLRQEVARLRLACNTLREEAAALCCRNRVHRILIDQAYKSSGPRIFKFTTPEHEKLVLNYCICNAEKLFASASDARMREIRKCKSMLELMAYREAKTVLGLHPSKRRLLDVLHAVGFGLTRGCRVQNIERSSDAGHMDQHQLGRAYIEYVCDGFASVEVVDRDYGHPYGLDEIIHVQMSGQCRVSPLYGDHHPSQPLNAIMTIIYRYE